MGIRRILAAGAAAGLIACAGTGIGAQAASARVSPSISCSAQQTQALDTFINAHLPAAVNALLFSYKVAPNRTIDGLNELVSCDEPGAVSLLLGAYAQDPTEAFALLQLYAHLFPVEGRKLGGIILPPGLYNTL